MIEAIKSEVSKRGITRLCHFTPSQNLQHIAAGRTGILATSHLRDAERQCFNATDLARYDGHTGHICCSIQYPNAWYFDRARQNEVLFLDWVVLLIDPAYLWKNGTLFCARNASANSGAHIKSGADGFENMFRNTVLGSRAFNRSPKHLPACPTDQQAEVLVPDRIRIEDIVGVAVVSAEQAATEQARLRANGLPPSMFRFVVSPILFEKHNLSMAIQYGLPVAETVLGSSG